MRYPEHIEQLMHMFRKLPGVGAKSAERFCFELLGWPTAKLKEFTTLIQDLPHKISSCHECGAFFQEGVCHFCSSQERNREQLCIVASPKDLFLIEATGQFNGLYHVIGGLLSPFSGRDKIPLEPLKERIKNLAIKEIIIAFDGTLEGDASTFYIKEQIKDLPLHISRLAFGMPAGSLLEFAGEGSLAQSMAHRREI